MSETQADYQATPEGEPVPVQHLEFWQKAEITPKELYRLRQELKEARAEIERLNSLITKTNPTPESK